MTEGEQGALVRPNRRGYKEGMVSFRRTRRMPLPVLAALLVALGGCSEPTPTGFVSKEDKFRAGFPSEPRVIDQPADMPLRPYTSRLYTVEGPNGAFTV